MTNKAAIYFYRYVCKRTSTFALAMVVTSIFFERTFDLVCETIYEKYNYGKLWMHIKHKYEQNIDKVGFTHTAGTRKKIVELVQSPDKKYKIEEIVEKSEHPTKPEDNPKK